MTPRVLFAYAVLLLAGVTVGFALADGPGSGRALVVPAICALLVGGVAAGGLFLGGPLRTFALRMGAALPIVVGAALAMRAIRVDDAATRHEAAWLRDVAVLLWGLAAVSVLAFLLLQYDRLRERP